MNNLNLIDLDKKKKEELAKFEETESGADCQFTELPQRAQEIALDHIATVLNSELENKANYLTRLLDTDRCFREAVGCTNDDDYPEEVDVCQRLLRFKIQGVEVL